MLLLFLLFTAVPFVELALLLKIGELMGAANTFLLVIVTGVVGAALARWQGWQAMRRIQDEMRSGVLPAAAVVDGVLILMAGLLLVTPGVLTDVVGLGLLVPPVRALVRAGLRRWLAGRARVSTTAAWQDAEGRTHVYRSEEGPGTRVVDARVIDARVVDENDAED